MERIKQYPQEIHILKGNHEEFVLFCAAREFKPGVQEHELRRFAHWTANQLDGLLDQVADWGDELELTDLDGGDLCITHGTRLGKRDTIREQHDPQELEAKLGEPRSLFITAHTHQPMLLQHGGRQVVNIGSVGSPFDRDPRAGYGRFSFSRGRWRAEIIRLEYDTGQTERDYRQSGFLAEGGPFARIMLTELQQSRGLMGPWMRQYHQAVLGGEITVEEAVNEYLDGV
jgi:predicted phosphodiesterase